jgi:N-acetyl-anhydromuramyl-L-alanine amidase AmpD
MARSAEYPDLPFVAPRAWGTGRDGKGVRYVVIHYTAGSERSTSAEDGAAYDARRTDGTSTHYFVDSNSVIQCVPTKHRANAARAKGNRLGIQYELCGTVQTRAQWLDSQSLPTLRLAAKQVARDCHKYNLPVRRLTTSETRRAWTEYPNGPRGIVGHVDCTNAYPEDGGDHTDPGPAFPWDTFLALVREELDELEDDMSQADVIGALNSEDGQAAIRKAVAATKTGNKAYPGRDIADLAGDLHAFLDDVVGDGKGAATRPTKPGSLGEKLRELAVADVPARVAAVENLLQQILDVLNTPAPPASSGE